MYKLIGASICLFMKDEIDPCGLYMNLIGSYIIFLLIFHINVSEEFFFLLLLICHVFSMYIAIFKLAYGASIRLSMK